MSAVNTSNKYDATQLIFCNFWHEQRPLTLSEVEVHLRECHARGVQLGQGLPKEIRVTYEGIKKLK